MDDIVKGQARDPVLRKLAEEGNLNLRTNYRLKDDEALMKHERLCVPNEIALKNAILEEVHNSTYAIHPGSTKMYRTMKKDYWLPRIV